MKKYSCTRFYRGVEITASVCALRRAKAAIKLDVTVDYLKNYGYEYNMTEIEPFDGVQTFLHGEFIFGKKHKMKGVDMPMDKLQSLVDKILDKRRK
jgi:hypothetical protein